MRPLSLYGVLKTQAEAAVLRHPGGVSLRFGTLFGPSPRMRLDLLVNDLAWQALVLRKLAIYEPNFRRCVLHVLDASRAICAAIFSLRVNPGKLSGKPWNVGAESPTKAEICEALSHRIDFKWEEGLGKDPDQRDYAVSSDAFRQATGWEPLISLDEGIQQLIRLYAMPYDGTSWSWRNA